MKKAFEKLNSKLNLGESSFKPFILGISEDKMRKAACCLLVFLSVLPIFISITVNAPSNSVAGEKAYFVINGIDYVLDYVNGYWFLWIQLIGVAALILAVYRLAFCFFQLDKKSIDKNWLKRNLLPVSFLLLFIWSIISALHSNNWDVCFKGQFYRHEGVLTYGIYGAIFIAASMLGEKHKKILAESLAATAAVIGLMMIIEDKVSLPVVYMYNDPRAAMFHQYNHLGYFLAICTPIVIGLFLMDKKRNFLITIVRLAEMWLIFNAVAFNSVRGSFVAIFMMLVCWHIVLIFKHRECWKKIIVIDALLLCTVLFMNTGSTLVSKFGILLNEQSQLVQNIEASKEDGAEVSNEQSAQTEYVLDNIGSGRGQLWNLGIQFAKEEPIFGYGPDNLGDLYHAVDPKIPDRAHNELIQIAASLGLPALIFYLLGLAGHLRNFFVCFKKMNLLQLTLFAAVGGYLVSSMFGNSMYYTTPYYFMMLGLSYGTCRDLLLKNE